MITLLYLLLKKENIPFYAIYAKIYYRKLFFSLFLGIAPLSAIYFLDIVFFKIIVSFYIILHVYCFYMIITIKNKNEKAKVDLINRYKRNEYLLISEYEYINSFLIREFNTELNKNDFSIRSVSKQARKIILSSDKFRENEE
jgi:hypothetical protein